MGQVTVSTCPSRPSTTVVWTLLDGHLGHDCILQVAQFASYNFGAHFFAARRHIDSDSPRRSMSLGQ
ncbi:hypothetical protein OH76DRAFT_1490800 [Lentinus brumalis]|uniref:Uncharacterized protein n=1 Tax=Lentinus brumalis TaxID=2498619 RepID=A0A371CHS3_9APHY|nr:hypothetical protein OH76DRAFT_1490800 [Polyporus brumalis]